MLTQSAFSTPPNPHPHPNPLPSDGRGKVCVTALATENLQITDAPGFSSKRPSVSPSPIRWERTGVRVESLRQMNRALKTFLLFSLLAAGAGAADLRVDYNAVFNGVPCPSIPSRTAPPPASTSPSRDWISHPVRYRAAPTPDGDGELDSGWIGLTNWSAYLGLRDGKTNFTLPGIPAGNYDRVRFHVGLKPAAQPRRRRAMARQPSAQSRREPSLLGLVARIYLPRLRRRLAGRWQARQLSYHLATDRQLMTVGLPATLDLHSGRELQSQFGRRENLFPRPTRLN